MKQNKLAPILFGALSFLIPLILFLSNSGNSLGFADGAEFALVTKLCGIAHPPGFPSYITIAWLWTKLFALFGIAHIKALVLFSATSGAASCLFLYLASLLILNNTNKTQSPYVNSFIACISAISFSTGVTAWHWNNSVEVYAFHVFAISLLLYGLTRFHFLRDKFSIIIASVGLALALANHHLTAIIFCPFILFFFRNQLFVEPVIVTTKGKKKQNAILEPSLVNILQSKPFLQMVMITTGMVIGFYGWMFVRASADLPFKFGNPDTLDRLFYHLSGGAWIKNTESVVEGLVALRFPYFMHLTFEQLFLFIPFALIGIYVLINKKLYALLVLILGYYLFLLMYQLRIDQTSDTDAYMLPAFFVLCLLLPYGMAEFVNWNKNLLYVLPMVFALQAFVNFSKTDVRRFDVSDSLMKALDQSTPKNSTLLISDWTLVINYYYHRIAENFRPDLTVLNYDLKFTNYKMLPELFPQFYNDIKPEYDQFIKLLGEQHPEEIYNTGCTLDSPELTNAFLSTIVKIRKHCKQTNTTFLCDPKAYVFLMQQKVMNNSASISGCFVADTPTGLGKEFLDLNFAWLGSPMLLKEPSASDKLVDFEAMLDFSRNYYKAVGDNVLYTKAETSYARVKSIQRQMKVNMPFVYRAK